MWYKYVSACSYEKLWHIPTRKSTWFHDVQFLVFSNWSYTSKLDKTLERGVLSCVSISKCIFVVLWALCPKSISLWHVGLHLSLNLVLWKRTERDFIKLVARHSVSFVLKNLSEIQHLARWKNPIQLFLYLILKTCFKNCCHWLNCGLLHWYTITITTQMTFTEEARRRLCSDKILVFSNHVSYFIIFVNVLGVFTYLGLFFSIPVLKMFITTTSET